jgi:hypothetical protein
VPAGPGVDEDAGTAEIAGVTDRTGAAVDSAVGPGAGVAVAAAALRTEELSSDTFSEESTKSARTETRLCPYTIRAKLKLPIIPPIKMKERTIAILCLARDANSRFSLIKTSVNPLSGKESGRHKTNKKQTNHETICLS